ncbi:MAG: SMC-Scp complex subunit ScpB [Kiritimatiellae bacterium]|nr:SMC-Scp complex subunit ScpB [Kiritimatiellia bacterium]MDW8458404.1 SMC-Scp complex subunit ScpB [Verrucomicrobiota bacterium]
MTGATVLPELRQIIGALLFAAKGPIGAGEIRRCLRQVAEERGGSYRDFAELSEEDILRVIMEVREQLREARLGIVINEIASGFRMENDPACGPWLRAQLQKGRPNRLSRPALETLAVIAYRQPCTRAEIEAVRGVAVDAILRNLMDMQLVRITGRSELPGRPWLFGTTQKFLEYFGLKDIRDLPGIDELRRMEAEQKARDAIEGPEQAASAGESPELELEPSVAGASNTAADAPEISVDTMGSSSGHHTDPADLSYGGDSAGGSGSTGIEKEETDSPR